jgi:hypothetical protein
LDLGGDAALVTATLAILAGALPVVARTTYQSLPPTHVAAGRAIESRRSDGLVDDPYAEPPRARATPRPS